MRVQYLHWTILSLKAWQNIILQCTLIYESTLSILYLLSNPLLRVYHHISPYTERYLEYTVKWPDKILQSMYTDLYGIHCPVYICSPIIYIFWEYYITVHWQYLEYTVKISLIQFCNVHWSLWNTLPRLYLFTQYPGQAQNWCSLELRLFTVEMLQYQHLNPVYDGFSIWVYVAEVTLYLIITYFPVVLLPTDFFISFTSTASGLSFFSIFCCFEFIHKGLEKNSLYNFKSWKLSSL